LLIVLALAGLSTMTRFIISETTQKIDQ